MALPIISARRTFFRMGTINEDGSPVDVTTWAEGDVALSSGLTVNATLARAHLLEAGRRTCRVRVYRPDGTLEPEALSVHARRVIDRRHVAAVAEWLTKVRVVHQYAAAHGPRADFAEMSAAARVLTEAVELPRHRYPEFPAGFRMPDGVRFVHQYNFAEMLGAAGLTKEEFARTSGPFACLSGALEEWQEASQEWWVALPDRAYFQLGQAVATTRPDLALSARDTTGGWDLRTEEAVSEVLERWALRGMPQVAAALREAGARLDRAEQAREQAQRTYDAVLRYAGLCT